MKKKRKNQNNNTTSPDDFFLDEEDLEAEDFEEDLDVGALNLQKNAKASGSGKSSGSGSRRQSGSKRKRKRRGPNVHVIFFLVLAVLFAVTIIRLIIWNQGTSTGYDPNEQTDEFDVELLDYVQPLNPALLEGREDDGITSGFSG